VTPSGDHALLAIKTKKKRNSAPRPCRCKSQESRGATKAKQKTTKGQGTPSGGHATKPHKKSHVAVRCVRRKHAVKNGSAAATVSALSLLPYHCVPPIASIDLIRLPLTYPSTCCVFVFLFSSPLCLSFVLIYIPSYMCVSFFFDVSIYLSMFNLLSLDLSPRRPEKRKRTWIISDDGRTGIFPVRILSTKPKRPYKKSSVTPSQSWLQRRHAGCAPRLPRLHQRAALPFAGRAKAQDEAHGTDSGARSGGAHVTRGPALPNLRVSGTCE
jgi:hypothetical protein